MRKIRFFLNMQALPLEFGNVYKCLILIERERHTLYDSYCLCKQSDCMLISVVYYCLPLESGHEYKCLFFS